MRLVDSHAHLDSPQLRERLPEILRQARLAGVEAILSVACVRREEESLDGVLALAGGDRPRILVAAGVHPHDAAVYNQELEDRIARAMRHPEALAWGEIGLDFYYDNSPRDTQEDAFRRQLRAARRLGKPVIIHSRDAAEETCRAIEEEFADGAPGGVMHCFTYDLATARRCLDFGFYLSFGGILTFPRSEQIREVARMTPADRFLLETDSPYLAPAPHRGKPNQPAWVAQVAEKMAEIRQTEPGQIGLQSVENFERLFGWPSRPAR